MSFCLGCNANVNDNVNDLRSSFANNVNDDDDFNDLRSSFANNVNDNVKDKDNVNYNVIDNDLRSSFANNVNDNDDINDNDNVNDNVIYQFDEKHGEASVEPVPGCTKSYQKGKPTNKECLSNNTSINTNEDLQSWLNDDDIITEATFPDNFRCIISGPSECGKTFLIKKLILA